MDLLLAPLDAWLDRHAPVLISVSMLVVGALFAGYAVWGLRAGYLYWSFKSRFDEFNRVEREGDPFLYWIAITGYGVLGLGALVMGLYGLHRIGLG